VADGDVSVDSDEGGRPDGGRVRDEGDGNDEDDDECLAVLLVERRVQTGELEHGVDTVQRKRRHQQQIVHHRNALCSASSIYPVYNTYALLFHRLRKIRIL